MSTGSFMEPSRSPAFSVIAESEVGSEISFESLDRDAPRSSPAALATTVMPSATELDGLSFHPTYATKDRMILFQAEKTLFRVHAHFFIRDSPHFRSLLSTHLTEQTDMDATQETLLRLDGDVKRVDFERLLAIMYPLEFGKHSLTTLDEWTSVLHLSSKWGFETIRSLALRELLPLASPVDKIVLGRKYGLQDWLAPAFVAVCARAEPLSLAEARRMHIDDIARIHEARERARGTYVAVATETAQDAVAAVFGDVEMTTTGAKADADALGASLGAFPSHAPVPLPAPAPAVTASPVVPKLAPDSAPQGPFLDLPPTSEPDGDDGVDDGLMDTLAAWSRLCSLYELSIHKSWDPDPSSWPNSCIRRDFAGDYACVLKYVEGPEPQAASLRRLASAMLQSDLHTPRPGPCVHLWRHFRDLANNDDADLEARLRAAEVDRLFTGQCLALIAYQLELEKDSSDFTRRGWLIPFFTRLLDAGLLPDATLRPYFARILPTLGPAQVNCGFIVYNLRPFLKQHGKFLDGENCRNLMDDMFAKLRKRAFEWEYRDLRQPILDLDDLRRKGWNN